MVVNFENCHKNLELPSRIYGLIKEIFNFIKEDELLGINSEVNLLFVDNETIREYNFKYRGIDKDTDCLSFPMLHYGKGEVFKDYYQNHKFCDFDFYEGRLVLGDIIISLDKAMFQSVEFDHSFHREVCYLFIHSLLHLLGYDHMNSEEKKIMREKEEGILSSLDVLRD